MLRMLSFIAAVVAIMAIPSSQADARSGGMRMGSSHVSGARSFSGVRSVGTVRSFNAMGPRRVIVSNHRFHHHRRFPFVVGVGAYGLYDTCWRWVPSVYGYRRIWVCDPYPY